jgi:hypothetical protein
MSGTPEYRVWVSMKSRCSILSDTNYPLYGARGIQVCERWKYFENFFEDMGQRPSKDHSIGRIDNSEGYGPHNCRWETVRQQARNKRNTNWVEYNGERISAQDLAERLGIPFVRLKTRLRRGWSVERATGGS